MVEVGVHLIKNGTLHRRIVRVLLNVFFFYGVLLLSIFREWLYWIGVVFTGCQVPIFSYFSESFLFPPIFLRKPPIFPIFLVHAVQRLLC